MPKEIIGEVGATPLAPAVRSGSLLFVSGQVPVDPVTRRPLGGDVGAQTTAVLERVGALVEAAGGTIADIVKTTVLMTDITQFAAMNEAYGRFFGAAPPARSTFEVRLAIDVAVEIEAIAVLPA